MFIDKKTFRIKENNYHKLKINKQQIILSFSLRKDHNGIIRNTTKEFGNNTKWNTYTISRDGIIYEHYNPQYYSDFMGFKYVDKKSISIVLENMGSLSFDGLNYINCLNEICEINNVIEKKYAGQKYWEIFPEEQLKSLIDLTKFLINKFDIEKRVIEFHYLNKEIKKYNGIVFKSNYTDASNNINPLFDIKEYHKLIQD